MNIFKWLKKDAKDANAIKTNKPNPYSVEHKFQWYVSGITNPEESYSYSIKHEIVEPETYNCIFAIPFKFAVSELYDENWNLTYDVNITYINDNNSSNIWPTGYANIRFHNNTIEYSESSFWLSDETVPNRHKSFTEIVKVISNIDEDFLNLILKDILVQLKDNDFKNIIKSVENAFIIFTHGFVPEKFIKALEDDYSTSKLKDEITKSIIEYVQEDCGFYYDPVIAKNGSVSSIEDIIKNIELIVKATERAGYTTDEIKIALDVASSEWYSEGGYLLPKRNKKMSAEELISYYGELISKYPIISIEDGTAEEDWEGWQRLTAALGDKIQLVGDDLFVTNTSRLKKGIELGAANSILVKLNQIGTLTETLDVIELAKKHGYTAVISVADVF